VTRHCEPICEVFPPNTRTPPQSTSKPPTRRRTRPHAPSPSVPLDRALQANTSSRSRSCSWLHPLKLWSLRQTRGGSSQPHQKTGASQPKLKEPISGGAIRLLFVDPSASVLVVVFPLWKKIKAISFMGTSKNTENGPFCQSQPIEKQGHPIRSEWSFSRCPYVIPPTLFWPLQILFAHGLFQDDSKSLLPSRVTTNRELREH